jgi:hypothetical protein
LHLALITATPFEYVAEAVLVEVDLVDDAITAVVVENFPPATGEFPLVISVASLNVIAT